LSIKRRVRLLLLLIQHWRETVRLSSVNEHTITRQSPKSKRTAPRQKPINSPLGVFFSDTNIIRRAKTSAVFYCKKLVSSRNVHGDTKPTALDLQQTFLCQEQKKRLTTSKLMKHNVFVNEVENFHLKVELLTLIAQPRERLFDNMTLRLKSNFSALVLSAIWVPSCNYLLFTHDVCTNIDSRYIALERR